MNEQLKKLDKKLDEFLDDFRSAIESKRARFVYRSGRLVLEYVIREFVDAAKIKVKGGFSVKKPTLNDCLVDKRVEQKLLSIDINYNDVMFIKNAGNESSHPDIDSEDENIEFNPKELYGYTDKLLDICGKIMQYISGDHIDMKEACKIIYATLDFVMGAEVYDDVDYDSLDKDLLDDPVQRIPICICLDISGSMRTHGKFDQLKEALKVFSNAILEDPKAREAAEVAVILFNIECQVLYKFGRISKELSLENGIIPRNGTKISIAIEKGLELLDARKKEYVATEVEYYQPWLVIISDGVTASEDYANCDIVKKKLLQLQNNRKLTVFSIPIIPNDIAKETKEQIISFMDGFSVDKSMVLDSQKIREFFRWLSRSVSINVRTADQQSTSVDKQTDDWRSRNA